MSELGLTSQEDAAEEIVEKSDTLATGIWKLSGFERGDIRSDAKVFRMVQHRAQQAIHRKGESLLQRAGATERT